MRPQNYAFLTSIFSEIMNNNNNNNNNNNKNNC